jgi:hypothetical protein
MLPAGSLRASPKLCSAAEGSLPLSARYTTSTIEIAEMKRLAPFFSSVAMIVRAVGESCFEPERYQITAWV